LRSSGGLEVMKLKLLTLGVNVFVAALKAN